MDITDLYATIAAGDPTELSEEDLRWVRKPLYERALREVDAAEPARRLAALRVAAWLGLDRAIAVPAKLVRDRDRGVRVSAFNLAVAAGDAGRPLLRDLLLGTDDALTAASLELLARVNDQAALVSARRHVAHDDPAVQVAAITLVGRVGGASTRPALADRPDDPEAVRQAKAQARAWLDGDVPRPGRAPWWEGDGALDTSGVLVATDAQPVYAATGAPPPPPPETDAAADAANALVPAPPTSPVPVEADPVTGTIGLPDPLPEEPRALAKLYGMVDAERRRALLPHLEQLDGSALASVWLGWSPGSDPAVGQGIALVAAHLGRTAFLSKARAMLRAEEPAVRAAAAEALGALGGKSTLTALRPLLADDASEVRAATIRALLDLSARVDLVPMARGWVNQLADDEAPEVAAALSTWPAS